MITRKNLLSFGSCLGLGLLSSCSTSSLSDSSVPEVKRPRNSSVPTWSVQYEGPIVARGKDFHIVDLYDVSDADLAKLRSQGTKPIAYFSSQYEAWRKDAALFQPQDLGSPLDKWPKERWVNSKSQTVRDIMLRRMDLAQRRGFYGVDVDNVDFYAHPNGFNATAGDSIDYIRFLAKAAHARGLKFGLKNATDLIPALRNDVDFYVNEEAHQYMETPVYMGLGKPVVNLEYRPLSRGTPGIYTIYKKDAVMDGREIIVEP